MEQAPKSGDKASAGTKRPNDDGDAAASNTALANKPKKIKTKHMDPAILDIRRTIQQCCATNDLIKAMDAFERALANDIRIEPQTFYNLLNLCDGLAQRGIHVGTPKPTGDDTCSNNNNAVIPPENAQVDIATRQKHAFCVKARMDKLQIPLTETAYTAIIKLLCKTRSESQVEQVQKLLAEAEQVQQCQPKLRMYTPVITAYCDMGQMLNGLAIWLRLSKQDIALTEREYLVLLRCATATGNHVVAERVISYLAEDVLVPSRETSQAIQEWFESPAAVESLKTNSSSSNTESASDIASVLKEIAAPQGDQVASMGPVQCKANEEWTVTTVCNVIAATGVLQSGCLQGESLQPVTVSDFGWREMKKMNETIVVSGKLNDDTSQYQGGRKGPKRALGNDVLEERRRRWAGFDEYLQQRTAKDGKLDVVIDGANVGYYETNFAGAPKHVDYRQIDSVVRHFRKLNKTVLVFLHARHFSAKLMPRNAEPIVRWWRDQGILYETPAGMNDDWFWMHAALDAGPGTLVLTNDEMRDHSFQMLAPRSFMRWKDRHQIHFGFGEWKQGGKREIALTYPEIYSRRIQRVVNGLVVPRPKRGDENRFLDGSHSASDDPIEETYLCIRPKPKES